jgi:hypothetical protein
MRVSILEVNDHFINLTQQIISQWQLENVPLNPGATEAELAAFEEHHDLALPAEFRYFYSVVNGMPDLESDKYLFSLWPLARMTEEYGGVVVDYASSPSRIEIAFGDVLIDSYRYILTQNIDGHFVVKIQDDWETLGDSFANFWERYLAEPSKLHL